MVKLRSVAAVTRVRFPSGTLKIIMIDQYLELARTFIVAYGLAAVFLLGFIEEIVIFIPSSVVFVAIGFLLIDAKLGFFSAIVTAMSKIGTPGALGVTVGSLLIYWLVYWGGKPLIFKLGGYINLKWHQIENLNKKFTAGHFDEISLLFLRTVPILPVSAVTIFCGLIRLKWREFVITTFLGTFLRVTTLSMLGWYLGKEYEKYAWQIASIEKYIIITLIAVVAVSLIYLHGKQKKSLN